MSQLLDQHWHTDQGNQTCDIEAGGQQRSFGASASQSPQQKMIGAEISFDVAKGKFGFLFAQLVDRLGVRLLVFRLQSLTKFFIEIAHNLPAIVVVRGALTPITALPTDTFAGPVLFAPSRNFRTIIL